MITIDDISKALEQHSKENEYFVVDANINNNNKISIYVDSMAQLNISDCAKINKWLRKEFEESLDDFELIVSTPGLDKPFKVPEQYVKNIGTEVEVLLKDGKKLTGILVQYQNDQITVETEKKVKNDKGKKELIIDKHEYKLEDIKSIKVVIKI